MPFKLGATANSPILIVGVAGAGLLGAVYIFSKNRPASETVGGTIPWSLDSLANWLKGTEGGPGLPGGEVNPTLPVPYPACQTQGCPPGQVCTAVGCVGIPVPDPSDPTCIPGDPCNPPLPRPWRCGGPDQPCPEPFPLSGRWGFHDQTPTEQAYAGDMGGGQPRAYGFDLANLAAQQYSRVFAFQQTDRPEESSYGSAH